MGVLALVYGAIAYLSFHAAFLYMICFLWGVAVPKNINTGEVMPMGQTLAVNLALLGIFAVQHTLMARPAFKEKITKILPHSVERSTFVLLTNLIFALIFWQWRPLPEVIWQVGEGPLFWVLRSVSAAGWLTVVAGSFMINHFDLFGLRQVWLRFKNEPYTHVPFQKKGLYKYVRHPLMLGMLIGLWATPVITQGYLLMAIGMTGYIFLGTMIEERTLREKIGPEYEEYRSQVPMFFPFLMKGKAA